MPKSTKAKNNFLLYKGKPLVKSGNIIYYGDLSEKFVIMFQILETKKHEDMDISTKVSVQLINTNQNIKLKDRIVKKTEKSSLYDAMDIADIWLNRSLSGNN